MNSIPKKNLACHPKQVILIVSGKYVEHAFIRTLPKTLDNYLSS